MTILQKMLIVPVCSLLLYGVYILYSYSEHSESTARIEKIRDQYTPLLTQSNENLRLFNQIRERHKDAIVAVEKHWLLEARTLQNNILANLTSIAQYPDIVPPEKVTALQKNLAAYFTHAEQFAQRAIQDQNALFTSDELLDDVDRYQQLSAAGLHAMQQDIESKFNNTIDDINHAMGRLLLTGSTISIALLLFLLAVTFWVSYTTYQRVSEVIGRMKSLAQGSTDFSQRLSHSGKDELGYLIYWFNKLSDKLESSYLQLEKVSITDKLTQLNNRTRTDDFFPQAINNARLAQEPMAVALLDIDHFKSINDTYGHQVGDAVLIQLANILKNHAAEHDFVARWGGEEFILIIQNATLQDAEAALDRLRLVIAEQPFAEVGKVTASFGFTMLKADDTPSSMIKRADEFLYEAKSHGRNRVFGDACDN